MEYFSSKIKKSCTILSSGIHSLHHLMVHIRKRWCPISLLAVFLSKSTRSHTARTDGQTLPERFLLLVRSHVGSYKNTRQSRLASNLALFFVRFFWKRSVRSYRPINSIIMLHIIINKYHLLSSYIYKRVNWRALSASINYH